MNKTIDRQYEIDILRIIAILGVVLFHYTFRGSTAGYYSIISFSNLGEVFKYGFLGVELFLMISGYTMFITSPHKSFKNFVISRIARLYPAFWVAVTLTSVIILLIGAGRFHVTPVQYIINLTMLNEFVRVPSIDGAWWYMSLILMFNFIVGILILLRLIKFQEYCAGIWLLLAVVLTFIHVPVLGTVLMSGYASFIVAGIIFQSAKTKGWNLYKYIIIISSLFFSIYLGSLSTYDTQQSYHNLLSMSIMSSLIILFYLAFYLITLRKQPLSSPKVFILYGAATYPLYLIHQYIGYMIFNSLGELFNKYLLLFVTIIIMVLVSIVIAKYIEPYIYTKLRGAIETIIHFMEKQIPKSLSRNSGYDSSR